MYKWKNWPFSLWWPKKNQMIRNYFQLTRYFHWDCQSEHEVLISICEKAQPNVDEKVYKEFLKDLSPYKYWLAIAWICEFHVSVIS